MNIRGLTLLEVMVALVILGLVVVTYLELFAGNLRAAANAQAWSQAVVYAEDAMESAEIRGAAFANLPSTAMGGGFKRRVEVHSWERGLTRLTVVVTLPRGGEFRLDRVVKTP